MGRSDGHEGARHRSDDPVDARPAAVPGRGGGRHAMTGEDAPEGMVGPNADVVPERRRGERRRAERANAQGRGSDRRGRGAGS